MNRYVVEFVLIAVGIGALTGIVGSLLGHATARWLIRRRKARDEMPARRQPPREDRQPEPPTPGLRVTHNHGAHACGAFLGTYTGPVKPGSALRMFYWQAWHGRPAKARWVQPVEVSVWELCPGCGRSVNPIIQTLNAGREAIAQMNLDPGQRNVE